MPRHAESPHSVPPDAPYLRKAPEALSKARAAAKDGPVKDAVPLLTHLLVVDPWTHEGLALARQWQGRAGRDSYALLTEAGRKDRKVGLLKALVAHLNGDVAKAVAELLSSCWFDRRLAALEVWVFEWLVDDEALKSMVPLQVAYLIEAIAYRAADPPEAISWQHLALRNALALADRVDRLVAAGWKGEGEVARCSGSTISYSRSHGTEPLGLDRLRSIALSKLGRFEEAVTLCRSAYDQKPGWDTAVAVANACRRSGDRLGAIRAFEQALVHDPKDATARLDLGDMHLQAEDWKNALRWYDEVLAQDGQHYWALPSALFCRFKLDGLEAPLDELRHLVTHSAGCTCGLHLEQMFGGGDIGARARDLLAHLKA